MPLLCLLFKVADQRFCQEGRNNLVLSLQQASLPINPPSPNLALRQGCPCHTCALQRINGFMHLPLVVTSQVSSAENYNCRLAALNPGPSQLSTELAHRFTELSYERDPCEWDAIQDNGARSLTQVWHSHAYACQDLAPNRNV